MTSLVGLSTEELRALAQEQGVPAYRGSQWAQWIYRRGARSFEQMTALPEALRMRLSESFAVGRSRVVASRHSRDGTVKLLLEAVDGSRVETVGLPYEDRFSCCVSTQVGCPIGCVFCATGASGYTRNLTAGEMVDQVLSAQEALSADAPQGDKQGRIDHVPFMGMGEPLLNYEATLKAVHLLNDEVGIGMRHLTISTSGYMPGILRLMKEKLQVTLAVSLHAARDDLRRQLVPGMSRWSVAQLVGVCRQYFEQTGRRVTFEYCLLAGVNDRDTEARELAQTLRGLGCHVNLIPYNQVPGLPYRAPSARRVQAFRETLEDAGIPVTQRFQRGADIEGACGQLKRQTA